jgi:phenylpropionate dioxygenase-like ring-hydroxylating dioxygenase large terminal subunit
MGAYFRFYERGIERQLKEQASRGVAPEPVMGFGIPQDGTGRVTDRRQLIPPLGLREYWYPALAASKVPTKRPLYWRMLGEEIAFFRKADGGIGAVSDVCPHRGASMSDGFCFYKGTISCPYHGATFDATGECKAFIPEGPDSKMPGSLKIKTYPTQVLRGYVFVWMGEGQPVDITEDVPPEFFGGMAEKTTLYHTHTYWQCTWMVAIENQNDSHNGFYAHRNSLLQLAAKRGRNRTPLGPRSRLLDDKALLPMMKNQGYYIDPKTEQEPYQMYYPGVDGYWPIGQWRRWVWAVCAPAVKLVRNKWRAKYRSGSEEWADVSGALWHLPSMVRVNWGFFAMTRVAVPVTANLSRIIYFNHRLKPATWIGRMIQKLWFHGYFNYWLHYNFSGQDGAVASPCRYWTPENLSSTDSHLVVLRKLVTERSRDAKRAAEQKGVDGSRAVGTSEVAFFKRQAELGVAVETTLDEAASHKESVKERSILG